MNQRINGSAAVLLMELAAGAWGRPSGFFSNLTPLFAALLSAVILGERPRLYHALAFALIVAGIVVSSRRQ